MPTHTPAGGYALWVASVICAVLVLAVLVLERWPAERTWVTALLTYAPQMGWVALPALMLAWGLLARNWPAAALNLGVALVALFALAGLQIPAPRPAGDAADTLRIATWNIHEYSGDISRLGERIRSWDCDIVCLQEARGHRLRALLPEYAEARFGDVRIFVRGDILEREPILPGHRYLRPALACDLEIRGRRLKLATVHFAMSDRRESLTNRNRSLGEYLANSVRVRGIQCERILEWLPDEGPVVVAGDFNTPANSMFHRRMRRRLTDSFGSAGLGFGYTFLARGLPVFRIDYIWTGNGVRPIRCWTSGAAPSDHRPVIAEVRLPPTAASVPKRAAP